MFESLNRSGQVLRLLRWLGPWSNSTAIPRDVQCSEVVLDDGPVRCHLYEPTAYEATGVYVVVPGLHFAGAEDPRLDRFCRILAVAGFLVVAPFLSSYQALVVSPSAAVELAVTVRAAAALATRRGLPKPALFSISFGSIPTIEVACSDELGDAVGGVVLFGGFADFHRVIRFAIGRRAFAPDGWEIATPHDPLNAPAVFINLLPHIEAPEPAQRLQEAWLEMARETWGKPHLRAPKPRHAIASRLAQDLPRDQQALFFTGCGLRDGGMALVECGLANAGDYFAFTNPAPRLPRLRIG